MMKTGIKRQSWKMGGRVDRERGARGEKDEKGDRIENSVGV